MNDRRKFLKAVGVVSSVGIAGCLGGGGEGSQNSSGGDSQGDTGTSGGTEQETSGESTTVSNESGASSPTQGNATGNSTNNAVSGHYGVSMKGMGQAGLFVQGQAAKWYTQDLPDVEITILDAGFDGTKQTQDAINLINQGIDGLLLNPWDAQASKQIVDAATEEDTPVMNFDTATLSKDILIGALFGQYRGGEAVAEKFKQMMESKGMESAKVITSVFNFESTTSQQRLYGFTENIPDSVEIVNRIESDGTADAAAPKTQSALQANPDVDAIYSNNVGSGMGALTALEQFGEYYKKDDEDHVMAFGIDGGPELNQRILQGYYDFAVDQPLHYYAPITLELMWDYLENGESALPQVGDTVTPGENLTVQNKEAFGINPWSEPFWGPADVVNYEADDQEWWPWMQCQHAMITQENADAPYLYGNVAAEYEEQN